MSPEHREKAIRAAYDTLPPLVSRAPSVRRWAAERLIEPVLENPVAILYEIATWIDKRTTDSDWTEADAREMDWAIRKLAAEWDLAKRSFAMKPEWFTVSVRDHGSTAAPSGARTEGGESQ